MDLSLLSWSLKLYRTSTLEVRASWLLGIWMLFDAVRFLHVGAYALSPIPLLLIPLVMYVHAMAHVGAARLVGGHADQTILSVINDQTSMQLPLNPARQFVVAAAGPLTSFVIGLICAFAAPLFLDATSKVAPHLHFIFWPYPAGNPANFGQFMYFTLDYFSHLNLLIFLINLLACAMFDGARMWRAILWPLFGLTRAIRWTVMLSFACAILIIGLSLYLTDWMLMFFGVICLLMTLHEHRSVKLGFDPVLQIEFDTIHDRRSQSWFGRWQQRRKIRALERQEREEREEQEILDRLLTKVSEHGLPALSEVERATLQRISRKQKARQETEIS
ncbi:MAG: hypothetical protein H0W78_01900 [Planctomycetes bacterium]|nr:hypothetical protein [Planctomycetota bacterium]